MSRTGLLLRIFLIVASVEAGIMLFLDELVHLLTHTQHENLLVHAVLDTFLLTVISAPLIIYFAVRPFERERDRAQALLKQQLLNLEEAQMIGRVGSWQFLDDKRTVKLSKEARRLLDVDLSQDIWSFEELIARVSEKDRAFVEKLHLDALKNGDSFTAVYRLVLQDGSERWVRERGMISGASGARYRGTLLDISESKAAEEVRKRFVSTVTHELRTPLTAIKGSFALLGSAEEKSLSPKASRLIEVGLNATDRLLRLIDELLDFDKASAGKLALKLEKLDLSEVLSEAIEANRAFSDSLGVRLEARGLQTAATVSADRDRIIQVITNLLSNAAKASGQGESVEIELGKENGSFCVSIADHGPGIPEVIRPRLFTAFVNSNSTYRAKVASTGLGLSISKEIVELHGGAIGFDTVEGQGSRFFFTLPQAA